MMDSPAWLALKPDERAAYLEMKRKYRKERSNSSTAPGNRLNITFTKSEMYRLGYKGHDRPAQIIQALIDKGFIDVIQYRYQNRFATIYGFSDRWTKYGTNKFTIPYEYTRQRKSNFAVPETGADST